jgi:hypothetical protein
VLGRVFKNDRPRCAAAITLARARPETAFTGIDADDGPASLSPVIPTPPTNDAAVATRLNVIFASDFPGGPQRTATFTTAGWNMLLANS